MAEDTPPTTTTTATTTEESSTSLVKVAENLDEVKRRMEEACGRSGRLVESVRLVAVSKTKPASLLLDAYHHGQRVFGENYVQELVGKAQELPQDIVWHYIGPLQSNKANLLVKSVVPHAAQLCVETVATTKLANKLNNAMKQVLQDNEEEEKKLLDVFVQVNTSGEESKSGVGPDEAVDLCRAIVETCPLLRLRGLMTIGAPGDTNAFDILAECRDGVESALGQSGLELSMGMSADFETAIEKGADNIRVGSTIFGERDYSNKT